MPDLLTSNLASDPDWFLHRIDAAEGRATFVRSDRNRLASTLFLDGRTSFATGRTTCLDLTSLGPSAGISNSPARFIFHMSFCGSTQLARLLGETGAGVVLKEPQALVDLADWQRSLIERGTVDRRFLPALHATTTLLSRNWPGSPPTMIKPSNWANTLIPMLGAPESRAVLVTIERRAFLCAVFRGGRDRLAFTARAAAHFAAAASQASRLEQAIASVDDPLDQMARLVLLAHELQRHLFATAACPTTRIEQQLISENPSAALDRACEALGVSWSRDQAGSIDQLAKSDAKSPGHPYTARGQTAENDLIERHHGKRFDRALAWADQARPDRTR